MDEYLPIWNVGRIGLPDPEVELIAIPRNTELELNSVGDTNINDLLAVVAVAESGSFRRAGAQIGIDQSAVSRRIRKIEDAIGASIFERSPTGARLTAAGWRFTSYSRRVVDLFLQSVRTARSAGSASSGLLRLGMIASLSLGTLREVVARFRESHSSVELRFVDADRSELKMLLSHRLLDIIVAAGEPSAEYGEMLISEEQLFIAVPGTHALACKQHLCWTDVETMTFVVSTEEPGPEIHDYILRRISNLGQKARIQEHRLEREGIMNLVGLGFGISLLCDHWRGVTYPNVAFVPLRQDGVAETIPFSLTWRPENDNPALRRFLSLAREVAKTAATSSEL